MVRATVRCGVVWCGVVWSVRWRVARGLVEGCAAARQGREWAWAWVLVLRKSGKRRGKRRSEEERGGARRRTSWSDSVDPEFVVVVVVVVIVVVVSPSERVPFARLDSGLMASSPAVHQFPKTNTRTRPSVRTLPQPRREQGRGCTQCHARGTRGFPAVQCSEVVGRRREREQGHGHPSTCAPASSPLGAPRGALPTGRAQQASPGRHRKWKRQRCKATWSNCRTWSARSARFGSSSWVL